MHISKYIVQDNGCSLMGQPAAIDTGTVSAHCRLSKSFAGKPSMAQLKEYLEELYTTIYRNGYALFLQTQSSGLLYGHTGSAVTHGLPPC